METNNLELERDYNSLSDYEKRVVEEKNELDDKIRKLSDFMEGEIFSSLTEKEQYLLRKQLLWITNYKKVLEERIDVFFEVKRQPITWTKTRGEEMIGLFGTEKWEVFELKMLSANFIDRTDALGKDGRRNAIVATDMEKVQMMAVKSLFS